MRKLRSILIFIFSVAIVLFILEYGAYKIQSARLIKEGYRFSNEKNIPPYPTHIHLFSNDYDKYIRYDSISANNAGLEYKKEPIMVFGDVFANSLNIPEENNLSSQLAHYTKRPVYNFASAGWGIQHMYFLLKNEPRMGTIKNPMYVIYFYVSDQRRRLNTFSFYPHHDFLYLRYKLSDGILIEDIPNILALYNSYFFRSIERYIGLKKSDSKNPNVQLQNYNLIKSLFERSYVTAKLRYSNLHGFVILRFVSEKETMNNLKKNINSTVAQLEYNMWKQLEDDGFIILDVPEIAGIDIQDQKYFGSDSAPTEDTYRLLIPIIANEIGLK